MDTTPLRRGGDGRFRNVAKTAGDAPIRSPERQRLAECIEAYKQSVERRDRCQQADQRLSDQIFDELQLAVRKARKALAEAQAREPARLVSSVLGRFFRRQPGVPVHGEKAPAGDVVSTVRYEPDQRRRHDLRLDQLGAVEARLIRNHRRVGHPARDQNIDGHPGAVEVLRHDRAERLERGLGGAVSQVTGHWII